MSYESMSGALVGMSLVLGDLNARVGNEVIELGDSWTAWSARKK